MPSVRAIILLVSSLVLAVSVFIAGVALTAYAVREPELHHFAHLDTPDLWTSQPVAIDRSRQSYERIEALPAVASLPPSDGDPQTAVAQTEEAEGAKPSPELASADPLAGDDATAADAATAQPQALDPAHAEWCYGRYRSYRMDDNSYQPFGGGPRQQCQSPWTPMTDDMQANAGPDGAESDITSAVTSDMPAEQAGLFAEDMQQHASAAMPQTAAAPVGSHEEWCHDRYRSYRIDDNSYQPFDGGPRRLCQSPYG